MRELAIFVVIFAILGTLLGVVIRVLGGSFGLDFRESWYLAFIVLVFGVPALANIRGFTRPEWNDSTADRILALIRGVGMVIAALACAVPVITNGVDRTIFLWGVGIGFLMNFGTLPFQAFFDHRRRHNK